MISLVLVVLAGLVLGVAIRNVQWAQADIREKRRMAMRKPSAASVRAAMKRNDDIVSRMIRKGGSA